MAQAKSEAITVKFDPATYELLQQLALKEDIKVATKVRHLARQALKENLIREKASSLSIADILMEDVD